MLRIAALAFVFCQSLLLVADVANAQDFLPLPLLAPADEVGTEEDEIETDRDSFTPATSTAGTGRTIYEFAHTFIDNRDVKETHSFPELIVRHGLTDWLELRLGWNYEVGGAGSPTSGNVPSDFEEGAGLERESRMLYGLKAELFEQAGWRPNSSFIVQGFTPTTGHETATDVSATSVLGWTLPNDWVWDSALRYGTGREAEDEFNVWAPSTVIKMPVCEKWKVHAEYFGIFSDGREDESVQHFFSPGAHYLVTENFEVGVRVGWGLNDESPNFFSNVGVGLRF